MEKMKKIKVGYIVFLLLSAVVMLVMMTYKSTPQVKDEQEAELPAPPEAPRLADIKVEGETLIFDPETRSYDIYIPDGNPNVPRVTALAISEETEVKVVQALFAKDAVSSSAKIFLDDGTLQNTYTVRFVKNITEGFELQYDDRYVFVPDYQLKEGEVFTFEAIGEGGNVTVDENGCIRAVGVSDLATSVNAYVNGNLVDSMTVTRTLNAVIDIFIVAGQGNAAGENGSAFDSVKPVIGTAYTAELDDRNFEMTDMSEGRQGFTAALADNWYALTGEKSLFVQTAISDVSVKQWVKGGEAYELAKSRYSYYSGKLNEESAPYNVKRVFVLWLQGEWDIANGMDSAEYIQNFNSFYNGFKEEIAPDMFVMIPVRSSFETEKGKIEPVCSAQYMLANLYDDVRVITRLTETATVENGFVSDGNLYYTQNGYNEIGKDCAYNLFMCYSPDSDRRVQKIEVFGNQHHSALAQGETVELEEGEVLRTVAIVLPLYAEETRVSVSYDDSLLTYGEGGTVGLAASAEFEGVAEIKYECCAADLSVNIKRTVREANTDMREVTYVWVFDGLNEQLERNNLTPSEKSDETKYVFADGILVTNDRQADFVLQKALKLTSKSDWSIEWYGLLNDNGILFGNTFDIKGYIYLAPYASNMGHAIRLVDDSGSAIYVPYGEFVEENRKMSKWMIRYSASTRTMTLYSEDTAVSEYTEENEFSFTFTNMLGRYGSDTVNYCYSGSLDWLSVTCNYNDVIEK